MNPVKIAQIGLKHDHAPFVLGSLARQDCFDLVGLATPEDEEVPAEFDAIPRCTVEQLLAMDDLDAVAIETAEDRATGFAQMFAGRGIAVSLDKPGTDDLPAFEKLIETLRNGNIPFQTGYMYRYNPLVQKAMAMIKSGTLGKIQSVEAHMSLLYNPAKRKWLSRYRGGMTYFLGCHLIDLVLQIMGEPEEIIPMNTKSYLDGVDVLDNGFVMFRYPTGISFIKTTTNEIGGFGRRQLVISGTEGTIEIKPFERYFDRENIMTDAVITVRHGDRTIHSEKISTERFNRYDGMMTHFAGMVRGERSEYSYDYEQTLFRILMKAIDG